MGPQSILRFRKEIVIAAIAALAGAVLALASLLALEVLSARLSFACQRLRSGLLTAPHGAPWRVVRCPPHSSADGAGPRPLVLSERMSP